MISLLRSCNLDEINLKVFRTGSHDIHLGPERASVQACALNWIKSHLSQAVPLGALPSEANRRTESKRRLGILKVVFLLFIYFKGLQM